MCVLTVIRDQSFPSSFRELLLEVLFLLMREIFVLLKHLSVVLSL